MAVPFSNTKLRVPKGFQNILEGLAREILRSQPKDLFEFGAGYFENLLIVRDETGHDPAVHGAKLEDRFYNNDSFKKPPSAGSRQQAPVLQTQARQQTPQKEATKPQEEKQADEEEIDIDLNDPEVADAATKIQAGFRGFKARKEVERKDSEEDSGKVTIDLDHTEHTDMAELLSDPEADAAALKIQTAYRQHKTSSSHDKLEASQPQEEPSDGNEKAGEPNVDTQAPSSETTEPSSESTALKGAEDPAPEDEINLEDPEIIAATAKIQAAYMKRQLKKPPK